VARFLILATLFVAEITSASSRGWRPIIRGDGTTIGFAVVAEGGEADAPILACRCSKDSLEFSVTRAAHPDSSQKSMATIYIDSDPPIRETWSYSSGRAALLSPDPRSLGARLTRASLMRFTSGNAAPIEFSVRGFESAWRTVASACPDRTPPPPPPRPEPSPEYIYVEELPEAIVKAKPQYPSDWTDAMTGTVVVQAFVEKDGSVGETKVVKSIPPLDDAAVACVRKWKFKPATSYGKPIGVWVAVPVRFAR